uniref:IS66 family transposase zinc-finger binding domain-containing protein n=1 Tax=Singulisphaera acidiphila TaxID=466153 RepID=UPI000315A1FB|nr:IS66 family transposase zinc-finger binding domain-containing protein [Singulisphaera acidiphila]
MASLLTVLGRIDRHEEHSLSACPECHGPVRQCRGSRTRLIEDIPADITPVVTQHTIHRSWCPHCRATVEPTVPDALPDSTIGLRVVVLSAWLHYLLGTTLAQIIDVFNFHLQFKPVLRRPDPDVAAFAGDPPGLVSRDSGPSPRQRSVARRRDRLASQMYV